MYMKGVDTQVWVNSQLGEMRVKETVSRTCGDKESEKYECDVSSQLGSAETKIHDGIYV